MFSDTVTWMTIFQTYSYRSLFRGRRFEKATFFDTTFLFEELISFFWNFNNYWKFAEKAFFITARNSLPIFSRIRLFSNLLLKNILSPTENSKLRKSHFLQNGEKWEILTLQPLLSQFGLIRQFLDPEFDGVPLPPRLFQLLLQVLVQSQHVASLRKLGLQTILDWVFEFRKIFRLGFKFLCNF